MGLAKFHRLRPNCQTFLYLGMLLTHITIELSELIGLWTSTPELSDIFVSTHVTGTYYDRTV
jgi:hypothetical protein